MYVVDGERRITGEKKINKHAIEILVRDKRVPRRHFFSCPFVFLFFPPPSPPPEQHHKTVINKHLAR